MRVECKWQWPHTGSGDPIGAVAICSEIGGVLGVSLVRIKSTPNDHGVL